MKLEEEGRSVAWMVGFDVFDFPPDNGCDILDSPAAEGHFAGMKYVVPGHIRLILGIDADDSETAVGKAIELAWSMFDTEGVSPKIGTVLLSAIGVEIDMMECTGRIQQLEAARRAFDNL